MAKAGLWAVTDAEERKQNIKSYLGGQGVVGRRHPVFSNHFRTGGKKMAGEPILGGGFWQKYQQPRDQDYQESLQIFYHVLTLFN